MQHDYFLITQATATTYSISLTTDPTPLYRVEVDTHPAADPAVQVFDLFDPLPLAAARLHPAVTTATTCTNGPAGDNPKWRPINQQNHTMLPLVAIPGIPPIERSVRWQNTNKQSKHLELYLREPLFGKWYNESDSPRDQLLARFGIHGMAFSSDRVIEIRRGGGLEFELGVLVQAFAVSEAERRKKLKKGK
ncbi:hypothetical protein V494_01857 [Pseudogymnoascus sp. VKM F-4513 (FW-928)]|nr:hypothetical protein V494_01857 [Pseudogymnoascus sp. VKM F-4513 (FW-928)]